MWSALSSSWFGRLPYSPRRFPRHGERRKASPGSQYGGEVRGMANTLQAFRMVDLETVLFSAHNVRPTGDPADTRSRNYLLESANLTVRVPWRKSKYRYSPEFSASCSGWPFIPDRMQGGLFPLTPSALL